MLEHFTPDSHSRASIPGLHSLATSYVQLVKNNLPRACAGFNCCPAGSTAFVPLFLHKKEVYRMSTEKAKALPLSPKGDSLRAGDLL